MSVVLSVGSTVIDGFVEASIVVDAASETEDGSEVSIISVVTM